MIGLPEQGRAIAFTPGVGLPGRAWSTGELTWADALAKESNFPRREAALRAGLGGGFAIPIPVGEPESLPKIATPDT